MSNTEATAFVIFGVFISAMDVALLYSGTPGALGAASALPAFSAMMTGLGIRSLYLNRRPNRYRPINPRAPLKCGNCGTQTNFVAPTEAYWKAVTPTQYCSKCGNIIWSQEAAEGSLPA